MVLAGLLTIGAGFALEGTASADTHFDETQFDLHLKDEHHGATWASKAGATTEGGECFGFTPGEDTPEGFPYLWHFVVPDYPANPGATPDVTAVYAFFSSAGEV